MGIWILAPVLYGNLLGSALLFSPQNCQHKITQNRVCNAFWWVFEWFSVIVITLERVGHISLRSNPICSRSDLANRKSSYPLFSKGSYENYCYVKNGDFCGTEIYRNSCSKDLRWKCHYCTKNENNNAMQQYFNVSAKKMVLSPFFTVFPEQKFQRSWFSKFLFRIPQNWFPRWFKMIFLWKLMKTLKKLTPLKFWGPGTKFS